MLNYQVLVHYHHRNGDYLAYDLWQWQENEYGKTASFSELDYFGIQGRLTYETPFPMSHAFVIVKKADWSSKSVDYKIRLLPPHLVTEVWLVEGDDRVYYSHRAAMSSHHYAYRRPHGFDMALRPADFDRTWAYAGRLGSWLDHDGSHFRLWAPTAHKVSLMIYENASNDGALIQEIPLKRGSHFSPNHEENTVGLWSLDLNEEVLGRAYTYRVTFEHEEFVTADPYAKAMTADGNRAVLLDLSQLNPQDWQDLESSTKPWRLQNPNQAVIYEMHIRDFSMSETSGVRADLRGTFLGAKEEGTRNHAGDATTFDYIKKLGVNYIQLQPVADRHKDYDEKGRVLYNWGYDSRNFNTLESSFSSNPQDPAQVIRDFKEMVAAYHQAGIGVIMDVVYNHVYATPESPLQLTVPDYYFRMNPDGSFQNGTGVGNETASENAMFRKYMIDSLRYYVEEFGIDGFRFDLMGIHDVETMNLIRQEMDRIDSRILLYGEGWDMGTGLAPEAKAKKDNARLMEGLAFFNDDQRDAIKGAEVYGFLKEGFVSGQATEDVLAKAILGSAEIGSYQKPSQVLNYVEAHDNYNLHDLLQELHPDEEEGKRLARAQVATALNLLMQGMAFMELGQEWGRTKLVATGPDGQVTAADKERAMNSYNAPDVVNQVDWNVISERRDMIAFISRVIALKTVTRAFSYEDYQDIYQHVYIHTAEIGSGLLMFEITDQESYLVLVNVGQESLHLPLDERTQLVVSNREEASSGLIPPLSLAVYQLDKSL